MAQFLFEGNFKRKPVQSLGGRSRHTEDREALLWKAELERQKRQNERARLAAVQVLQAAYRGMRDRKQVSAVVRQEFEKELGAATASGSYTVDSLQRQLRRLNYFFQSGNDGDIQFLCDLAKAMVILKDKLMAAMLQEQGSIYRVLRILEKGLTILSTTHVQNRSSIILRLFETFTDWSQVERVRTTLAINLDPGKVDEVVALLWTHLVLQNEFFERYKLFLVSKLVVKDPDSARSALQHYDYTVFYQRFLEAVRQLSKTKANGNGRQFLVNKSMYVTAEELVQRLLLKLAESVTKGDILRRGKDGNGVVEFVLLPRVAELLAEEDNEGQSLWRDQWLNVISLLTASLKKQHEDPDHAESVKMRGVMYSFLAMVCAASAWSTDDQEELLNVLNVLMPSVDNRKLQYRLMEDDRIDYDMEDMSGTDVEMRPAEDVEAAREFFQDRLKIYEQLKIVLGNMQLENWISVFSVNKWQHLYPIISCIIQLEPRKAAIHFRYLSVLYNNTQFMRGLSLHIMSRELKDKEELVVYCWLLGQLMRILHDGEFLAWIPLSTEELLQFIKLLENLYTEIVLGDKDVTNHFECYFKNEIAQFLMAVHDRNTRLNLFPEDVFISPMLSVVFPMETHGLRFQDFINTAGDIGPYPSQLSLLDQRLLRVLNDFPFAISFDDRVSIWHQILYQDHIERHIMDTPFGRQHIQIRRKYIYEDAFEKLSPENVPDLRADVRISLVNVVGADEAGIDGGGLLREFLTEAAKAGVDPNRGLFRVDSKNRLYPNPIAKKIFIDYRRHFFFMGRLVGKALYRQILLELPLAAFFMQLATFGSVTSAVDYLATLDPDLHKNLLKLKTFDGDWSELGLDFTVASDELGEAKSVELKPGGADVSVDKSNIIEYIHLVADYKINKEILEECRWFRSGLHDVVPVLRIFSWKEMQTLISGSDKPINVQDWKENTVYAGGYSATHKTVEMFWQVVEHFDEDHLRKLLKFVTSCSRPPLLGFKDLQPKFGISNAGITDRLPTAATCMNLLKLPEFGDVEALRERLVYAISAQAGFELS